MEKSEIITWIEKIDYLKELKNYIAKPSRSNKTDEVQTCAKFAQKLLEKSGLLVDIIPTSGNPVVFGYHLTDSTNPTILFYGHYDVQPEGNISMWNTQPFSPIVKDGKLWGRGSADNKGQHFAHLLAIRFIKTHYPNIFGSINIKFILDGDEERGSFSLPEFFDKHKDKLNSDLAIVSDGPSLVYDRPTIVGSVRGILTFQITISHNQEDVHSGNFGGLARTATQDLISLLASMLEEDGSCKIPGFYDQVEPPSDFEIKLLDKLEKIFGEIDKNKGLTPATKQIGKSRIFQNQMWPTFNINGLYSGGVGSERRTIIPSTAIASIDCRLVPNQRSDNIKNLIKAFVDKWTLDHGIKNIHIDFEHAMEPVRSSLNNSELSVVRTSIEKGFGEQPVLVPRLGGSLPLYLFPEILNQDVFLVPYALPDENNHAPNENLDLNFFKNGVVASVHLLKNLSNM